ncbi:Cytochrome P450 76A2 [Camellia lanceoleosa]|uniref:Cytochrome P450 76A2 n=1 Tax=Camellia lanceoleosa TaxID=1840588 RepID=A0ACC0HTF6_9ERIC|nr:Cytochrome P450 76A2 [Camellia lanceoleosa]
MEMVVAQKINETIPIRRKSIDDMLSQIENEAEKSRAIHAAHFVFLASFNMVGNLVVSRDLVGPESDGGSEFYSSIKEFMKLTGEPNMANLFSWLEWIDPQRLRKKMDRVLGKIL